MKNHNIVPLNYYLNSSKLDFLEISEDFFEGIGIISSSTQVDEIVTDLFDHEDTYIDDEGTQIKVAWAEAKVERTATTIFSLASFQDLSFKVPGLNSLEFVLISTEAPGVSPFNIQFVSRDDGSFELSAGLKLKLRFANDLLKPMVKETNADGKVSFILDTDVTTLELDLGQVEVGCDSTGKFNFGLTTAPEIKQPIMISSTGVIIDALADLSLNITGDGNRPAKASRVVP